ncbi:RNA-directed DNA polymerase from transposon X-element [Paramuricea clavata]|uniref:RNA-directed DNA polymerase from transposon X-element n=1 Tax=Paramuricea clavata TaxID=317549 RepID=A0A6S7FW12_PARCT|nr:RNA-directed DNA polymerase from transposon X-element [Paramuricea clavata]
MTLDYLLVVVFMVKNVNYVALDPGCNVVRFLDLFINQEAEELETRFNLDARSLKTIIDSMETEYDRQKFNAAARKKSQNLIEQNRLRNRASGASAKRKLDDIHEELIAKAIEQKTTALVGMDEHQSLLQPGTKHQSLLQPTEESGLTIRALPSHNFGDPRLYVTPSAYRFMSHKVKQMDGIQRVVLKDDSSVVTVRPKQYVGSSGSVWAWEHVYLQWKHPQLYEVHGQTLNPALRTLSAVARDNLFYFFDTTEKGDVECLAEDPLCKFRSYEKCCIEHVLNSLIDAQSLWKVSKDKVEAKEIALGNEIVDLLLEVTKELQNLRDILFCDAELARLFNLDWQMRIHLAVNDPCPAERTDMCIGDAVPDGGPLPYNRFQPHEDISESDMRKV